MIKAAAGPQSMSPWVDPIKRHFIEKQENSRNSMGEARNSTSIKPPTLARITMLNLRAPHEKRPIQKGLNLTHQPVTPLRSTLINRGPYACR